MTRKTKIGMLVGLAFIIVIGILLSDHMTSTTETPRADQARAGSDVRGGTTTPAPAPSTYRTEIPPPSIPTAPMPTQQELAAAHQPQPPAGPAVQNIQVGPGGAPAPTTNIAIQGSAPQPPVVITQPPAGVPNPGPVVLQQPDSPSPEEALSRWAGGNGNQTPAPPVQLTQEPRRTNTGGVPMAAVKQYKAEAGDNLHKIALKTMGVSTKETRDAILNANPYLKANPDKVIVGRTYVIPPSATGAPAPTPAATPAPAVAAKPATPAPSRPGGPIEVSTVEELNAAMQRVLTGESSTPAPKPDTAAGDGYRWYTVKENDTLWGIAATNLGAGSKLTMIQELNKELLKGQVTVHPGQKLRLPAKEVASANQ